MPLPTASSIVSDYLYGASGRPSDMLSEDLLEPKTSQTVEVLYQDFFDSSVGPGRFALASEFEFVRLFFEFGTNVLSANPADYSQYYDASIQAYVFDKATMNNVVLLGYTTFNEYGLNVANRLIRDSHDDWAERTFIWGGTQFRLSDSTEFVVPDVGDVYLQHMSVEIRPRAGEADDNFDFEGSDWQTEQTRALLEGYMDPSRIGQRVDLNIIGNGVPQTYSRTDYEADQSTSETWTRYSGVPPSGGPV